MKQSELQLFLGALLEIGIQCTSKGVCWRLGQKRGGLVQTPANVQRVPLLEVSKNVPGLNHAVFRKLVQVQGV